VNFLLVALTYGWQAKSILIEVVSKLVVDFAEWSKNNGVSFL